MQIRLPSLDLNKYSHNYACLCSSKQTLSRRQKSKQRDMKASDAFADSNHEYGVVSDALQTSCDHIVTLDMLKSTIDCDV